MPLSVLKEELTIAAYALKRAALLVQVAGGDITSDLIDVYQKKIEDFSVFLNFGNVAKIIGQEIPKDTIKQILVSLDMKVNSFSETGLGLTIPAYRVDVQEIDVIEEILRVYGYNNISFSEKLNATVSNSPRNEDYKLQI
jgi:phenylalanyl-tRNA synthetase beta chain